MHEIIYLPKWGMTMTEAHIGRWLKQVGDQVSIGEELVEVESDKALNCLTSPIDGILTDILVPAGEDVAVGTELAIVTPLDEV